MTKQLLEELVQRALKNGEPRSIAISLTEDLFKRGLFDQSKWLITVAILEEGARRGPEGLRHELTGFVFYNDLPEV